MAAPILLPALSREPRVWKNGGGQTLDVVSVPSGSGLDDFDWRVSIAVVDIDGPFSVFSGVTRHMVVLAGSLRLRGDGLDHTLTPSDRPFTFSGEVSVRGSPVDGPVRDLNLMVRSTRFAGRLRVVEAGVWQTDALSTVVIAPQAAIVSVGAARYELRPEDALLLARYGDIESGAPLIVVEVRDLSA